MRKTITIYGYDTIGNGVDRFSTSFVKDYNAGGALRIVAEIPEWLETYESISGEICCEIGGMTYSLNDMLAANKGNPVLNIPTPGDAHPVALKIIGREWINNAFQM